MISGGQDKLDWSKSFMYSLHETYFLIEKRLAHLLGKSGTISFSQFLILLPLHCQDEASQEDVSSFLHLTEATVSRHISIMEKEGYLLKKKIPNNRRKHTLTLTEKGKSAFKKAHTIIEKELKQIFSVLPEKERSQITKIFDSVLTQFN